MYITFFIISFAACIIGSICGIGGGIIIKPLMDAFGTLSVSTINFLSGCTVLAMTCYSIGSAIQKKESIIDLKTSTPLALGAVGGGIMGKLLFQGVCNIFNNYNIVGAVQSICLFFLTLGTLIYTINKNNIKTYEVNNKFVCVTIGLLLGVLSTFLGIGGGPINLIVLYFFFSMSTKIAAQNSLYIILFSQVSSLGQTILTKTIPQFNFILFMGMVICGIWGGFMGRKTNRKINELTVNRLFIMIMGFIMLINVYNTYHYLY